MERLEDIYDIMEETYRIVQVVRDEVNRAVRDGRDVASVIADESTRRGDIIDISQFSVEGEIDEDAEEFKARVLAVTPRTGIDENGVQIHCVEALCVILKPGDISSIDDFAAMYGEDAEEELETEDIAAEQIEEHSNTCTCGADLQMCETNQKVFGGHLND